MRIEYAPDRRQAIPPDSEVREVMEAVCRRCGLGLDRIRLEYIGGNRREVISKKGIRICRVNPYSLQVCIAGSKETVEANLYVQLLDNPNRGMSGYELFSIMTKAFIGRSFFIDRTVEAEMRQAKNNSSSQIDGPAALAGNAAPVQSSVALTTEATASDKTGTSVPAMPDGSSQAGKPQEHPPAVSTMPVAESKSYGYYFDDPGKLHLVVCALAMLCEEDTARPFGFQAFERILTECHVPPMEVIPITALKSFVKRGFIVRINPGVPPARYVITDDGVAFARGPVPADFIPTKWAMDRTTSCATARTPPPPPLAMDPETSRRLEERHAEHQRILASLAEAQRSLDGHRKAHEIDDEEKAVRVQIKVHERHIERLQKMLVDLSSQHKKLKVLQDKVRELERASQDRKLLADIAKLDELRKAFG